MARTRTERLARTKRKAGALALALGCAWLLATAVAVTPLCGPAMAQGLQKRNTDQPIDITADRLEVQQDKQVAIFTGRVDAVQGDIRLRADRLTVHYRQKEDPKAVASGRKPASQPAPKPAPAAGSQGSASSDLSAGAISLIEADGHVVVTSPEETAEGEHGVYNVDKRTITLTGDRVVLTRDKNVLRGRRATMNLDTGLSVLDSPGGDGRVRGLFVPEKKQKAAGQ